MQIIDACQLVPMADEKRDIDRKDSEEFLLSVIVYYTVSTRDWRKKICNSRHFHYIRAVIMTNGYYIFFMTVMSMRMHR